MGAEPALRELHKYLACLQKASVENMAAKTGTEWQWDFHPADSPTGIGQQRQLSKSSKELLTALVKPQVAISGGSSKPFSTQLPT